jgi:hypothetical protein
MRSFDQLRQVLRVAAMSAAAVASLPLAAEPARQPAMYSNVKYGFSLAVPNDIFVAAPARNPDAGALWQSRDGRARLLAVAARNEADDSLQTYRRFLLNDLYKGAVLDYAPMRDTWFVLSGRIDDMMFYERITFACDGRYIYGWQLNYPVAERNVYDRIVESVHRSYRAGRGEDGRCGRS